VNQQSASAEHARLEDLVPGVLVAGIGPGEVTIETRKWVGSSAVLVTYVESTGATNRAVLTRDHELGLHLAISGRSRLFDGKAADWRLVAEAMRIRYAGWYDPLLALESSNVEPLPHQITAVYEHLIPRSPLRFLLADDPGAGKTIMCGLYIKELILRGDLARCLVVAPGGLVNQWQDELYEKFGLDFDVLTNDLINSRSPGTVFDAHPLLIAKMDQLSRREDLQAELKRSDWDLVVVDEAHRMSAHYFGAELTVTKRYQLGQLLGGITRHFLLMTATPHSGSQESFQLFLALLDGDRFEGRFRDGVHSVNTDDLMRRKVKEDLLTMDGRPLFPERIAYTVPYDLSHDEAELYGAVSQYVREEMNRAERLKNEGEARRGNTVGFALTILQRRLASSPEAILRSLQRRRSRLEARRQEMLSGRSSDGSLASTLHSILGRDSTTIDDELEELDSTELEELEEDVMDAASAARTIAELEHEIRALSDLVSIATQVRGSGQDRKWTELRSILTSNEITRNDDGSLRKIIIFTEHRDTLNYLVDRIRQLLGSNDAVVSIHGGHAREQRRATQELFSQASDVRVLVATDAAGEGINLQRAHLMVNYDLPWNPNRIEQRFGRIHRIGQTEVCHLWNLVAKETREGDVFIRLLTKIEEQRKAYGGSVFDVLGEPFENAPLRNLLVEAIRYGDQPEVRARLDRVIDESVGDRLKDLLARRALSRPLMDDPDVEQVRMRLESARATKLQPHYIEPFFREAFSRQGGQMTRRTPGRYQITRVPEQVRARDRQLGTRAPLLAAYERVTFDPSLVAVVGEPRAVLITPGHPLLDAVVDLTIEANATVLKTGAVMFDPNSDGDAPRLLVALTDEVTDGHQPPRSVSKRFAFVELDAFGRSMDAGPGAYLDYEDLPEGAEDLVLQLVEQGLGADPEETAFDWAIQNTTLQHEHDVRNRVKPQVSRVRSEVEGRLTAEIAYWDQKHASLLEADASGAKLKLRPETAYRRARDLEQRMVSRLMDLDAEEQLTIRPPVISGSALIIPAGALRRMGFVSRRNPPFWSLEDGARAVAAVIATERGLGRQPERVAGGRGYALRSTDSLGHVVLLAVLPWTRGADKISISRNSVLQARNLGDDFRLATVRLRQDTAMAPEVRYLFRPFDRSFGEDFSLSGQELAWERLWAAGVAPR